MSSLYFDYEFVWSYLTEYIENVFNVKYDYGLKVENFLTGSYSLLGVISRKNVVFYFVFDYELSFRYLIKENTNGIINPKKIVVYVNPNDFLLEDELEQLFLHNLIRFDSIMEDLNNENKLF